MKKFFSNLWSGTQLRWRALRFVLLFIVGFTGFIMLFENKFIYYPSRYPAGFYDAPERIGEEHLFEDVTFQSADGTNLHGWWIEPAGAKGKPDVPTLLWSHGNAGNLSDRYDMILALNRIPARVFIFDYRGYGKSEGSPSEKGLYEDTEAAWNYLTTQRGIRKENLYLFGKSLGGAPAVELATRVHPAGLIIESSFTSIPDMAAIAMPFVPKFMIRHSMNSKERITTIDCPILIIHGNQDAIIPFQQGKSLYEAASGTKTFYEVDDAGHNDVWLRGGEAYLQTFRDFIVPAKAD